MGFIDRIVSSYKLWAQDTAERATKTFIQVFVLQLIASGWFTMEGINDYSIVKKAALAAGAAALSLITSAFSKMFGSPETASLIPAVTPAGAAIAPVVFQHGNNGDNV